MKLTTPASPEAPDETLRAKAPKQEKISETQLADQARIRLIQAHATPTYDLTEEPWVPVLRDGAVVLLGLRAVFTDAHRITDVAVPNPLLRAALRRFLGALAADLIRRDRNSSPDDWLDLHRDQGGFTTDQIDALFTAHQSHLWLWHPDTPFLQDHRLVSSLLKPQEDQPVQELLLHLPSGSSAAWWVKAGEPALQGGLAPDQSALWLIARWFYAVNGNCGAVQLSDDTIGTSQGGGTFAETIATVTHAFRVDGVSLLRTLLRGQPDWVNTAVPFKERNNPLYSCAWLDLEHPQPSADPLYGSTLNVASVLLAAADGEGNTTRFVRGPTPLPKTEAKALRDLALKSDAHRVVFRDDRGDFAIRVPPSAMRSDVLQAFHRTAFDGRNLRGVINSANCWLAADNQTVEQERLELFLVAKGGTGPGPVWEEAVGVEFPARYLDPSHPNQQVTEHIRAAVAIAFDPKTGVRPRLEWAVADLLAQPSPDGWKRPKRDNTVAQAVTTKTVNGWLNLTVLALEKVLSDDSDDALTEWRSAVWAGARTAFDNVASPYLTSSRYAPRYAIALRQLNRGPSYD